MQVHALVFVQTDTLGPNAISVYLTNRIVEAEEHLTQVLVHATVCRISLLDNYATNVLEQQISVGTEGKYLEFKAHYPQTKYN